MASVLLLAACGGAVLPEQGSPADGAATAEDGAVIAEDGAVIAEDGAVIEGDGGASPTDVGSKAGGIRCGTATCDSATQVCCATFSGSSCVAKGTCGGASLACSDPSSCAPGQVCCASGGPGGGGGSTRCQTTCSGAVLCATDADCRSGQRCVAAAGGYRVCRNPPPDGGPMPPPPPGDGGF
ncbi:MAG: hypothetical protein HYV09_12840 [Deltaproteobacteria bacterium]|nr:hypothetical protein [Deltaproteobacteria bacterium]